MSGSIRSEGGLTVIELMIVSALFMATLGIVSAILWTAMRTTRTAEQESNALEEARVAMARIERDIRGALAPPASLECTPLGYCIQVNVQLGDGTTDFVRYRVENPPSGSTTSLFRDSDCASDFSSCGSTQELLAILGNRVVSPPVEAFNCIDGTVDPASRGARVDILFLVTPLQTIAGPSGLLEVRTSAAARNLLQC